MRTDIQPIINASATAVSVAGRNNGRTGRDSTDVFSDRLRQASSNPVRERSLTSSATRNPRAGNRALDPTSNSNSRTPEVPLSRSQRFIEPVDGAKGQGSIVVTPFGTFDRSVRNSGNTRMVQNDKWGPMSGMRAYFYTHQPGEWFFDPLARREFEAIYGSKALVTLDWTFTVPENAEAEWVTNRPVDDTGRPLPKTATV